MTNLYHPATLKQEEILKGHFCFFKIGLKLLQSVKVWTLNHEVNQ